MSVNNLSLMSGATGITVTGGASTNFVADGVLIPSGVHVSVPADADFRTRRGMIFKAKMPTLVNGEYSKAKLSAIYVKPQILASGKVVFNLIRIEREIHPEADAATSTEFNLIGAQMLCDSEAANFWAAGSLL